MFTKQLPPCTNEHIKAIRAVKIEAFYYFTKNHLRKMSDKELEETVGASSIFCPNMGKRELKRWASGMVNKMMH